VARLKAFSSKSAERRGSFRYPMLAQARYRHAMTRAAVRGYVAGNASLNTKLQKLLQIV